jgi:hypothetical protein
VELPASMLYNVQPLFLYITITKDHCHSACVSWSAVHHWVARFMQWGAVAGSAMLSCAARPGGA